MMTIVFALTALFIAWIWVDYFRLIDVYDKNKLGPILLMFAFGCASVYLVFGFHEMSDGITGLDVHQDPISSFIYFMVDVALIEEFAKVFPFLIMVILFKNEFREPIDYIAFISISALGFSAVENYLYFDRFGATIIDSRSILCSVGHMFDTALIGYGIVLFIYHPKVKTFLIVPAFFLLAVISHGIYDAIIDIFEAPIWIILYFMITVSWYATIINNALNNSSFFDYKKSIDPSKISKKLLLYYLAVIGLQLFILSITDSVDKAAYSLFPTAIITFPIILVTCVRLSRFKLIHQHWHAFKIELPVNIGGSDGGYFRFKGDGHEEALMANYYNEFAWIYPVSMKNSTLGGKRLIYIEKIDFLRNEEVFYEIKLFAEGKNSGYVQFLIKPKQKGQTLVNGKHPIVSILDLSNITNWHDKNLGISDFRFMEWGYIVRTND